MGWWSKVAGAGGGLVWYFSSMIEWKHYIKGALEVVIVAVGACGWTVWKVPQQPSITDSLLSFFLAMLLVSEANLPPYSHSTSLTEGGNRSLQTLVPVTRLYDPYSGSREFL